MTKKDLAATISEVKVIVGEAMTKHVDDERALRHETAKHTNKMFEKILKSVGSLEKITATNSVKLNQHMTEEGRLLKFVAGIAGAAALIALGWLSWLSLTQVDTMNDVVQLQTQVEAMPDKIEKAVVNGLMKNFYPSDR